MIKIARKENLNIMLGCMNESTIGTAAIAHLSPEVDYVDADGPILLSEDLASGISYKDFTLIPSQEPGLGIKVYEDIFN
jgi:L-alanine-DL-glutamate epimerase-like enolase superfamily enzyme